MATSTLNPERLADDLLSAFGSATPPTPPRHPLADPSSAEFQALAQQHRLDPVLMGKLMQAESNFDPRATSPKGAQGLYQLMPDTQKQFRVSDPFDPAQNVPAGMRYYRQLLDQFDQSPTKALAAWNAGPKAVQRAGGVPLYPETRGLIGKVLGPDALEQSGAETRSDALLRAFGYTGQPLAPVAEPGQAPGVRPPRPAPLAPGMQGPPTPTPAQITQAQEQTTAREAGLPPPPPREAPLQELGYGQDVAAGMRQGGAGIVHQLGNAAMLLQQGGLESTLRRVEEQLRVNPHLLQERGGLDHVIARALGEAIPGLAELAGVVALTGPGWPAALGAGALGALSAADQGAAASAWAAIKSATLLRLQHSISGLPTALRVPAGGTLFAVPTALETRDPQATIAQFLIGAGLSVPGPSGPPLQLRQRYQRFSDWVDAELGARARRQGPFTPPWTKEQIFGDATAGFREGRSTDDVASTLRHKYGLDDTQSRNAARMAYDLYVAATKRGFGLGGEPGAEAPPPPGAGPRRPPGAGPRPGGGPAAATEAPPAPVAESSAPRLQPPLPPEHDALVQRAEQTQLTPEEDVWVQEILRTSRGETPPTPSTALVPYEGPGQQAQLVPWARAQLLSRVPPALQGPDEPAMPTYGLEGRVPPVALGLPGPPDVVPGLGPAPSPRAKAVADMLWWNDRVNFVLRDLAVRGRQGPIQNARAAEALYRKLGELIATYQHETDPRIRATVVALQDQLPRIEQAMERLTTARKDRLAARREARQGAGGEVPTPVTEPVTPAAAPPSPIEEVTGTPAVAAAPPRPRLSNDPREEFTYRLTQAGQDPAAVWRQLAQLHAAGGPRSDARDALQGQGMPPEVVNRAVDIAWNALGKGEDFYPAGAPAVPPEPVPTLQGGFQGGERFQTLSGRTTSPVPRWDSTSNQRTVNSMRRLDTWLLEEARQEVAHDDYQTTLLQGMKPGKLSQADRDHLNLVLFGDVEGAQPLAVTPTPFPGAITTNAGTLYTTKENAEFALTHGHKAGTDLRTHEVKPLGDQWVIVAKGTPVPDLTPAEVTPTPRTTPLTPPPATLEPTPMTPAPMVTPGPSAPVPEVYNAELPGSPEEQRYLQNRGLHIGDTVSRTVGDQTITGTITVDAAENILVRGSTGQPHALFGTNARGERWEHDWRKVTESPAPPTPLGEKPPDLLPKPADPESAPLAPAPPMPLPDYAAGIPQGAQVPLVWPTAAELGLLRDRVTRFFKDARKLEPADAFDEALRLDALMHRYLRESDPATTPTRLDLYDKRIELNKWLDDTHGWETIDDQGRYYRDRLQEFFTDHPRLTPQDRGPQAYGRELFETASMTVDDLPQGLLRQTLDTLVNRLQSYLDISLREATPSPTPPPPPAPRVEPPAPPPAAALAPTLSSEESSALEQRIADAYKRRAPKMSTGLRRQRAALLSDVIRTGVYTDMVDLHQGANRRVFEDMTGVKLPGTLTGTQALFTGQPFPVVPAAAPPKPLGEAPRPKKETKAQQRERERMELLQAYFTPGEIITAYGGVLDRVIAFDPVHERATVLELDPRTLEPDVDSQPRVHLTIPSFQDMHRALEDRKLGPPYKVGERVVTTNDTGSGQPREREGVVKYDRGPGELNPVAVEFPDGNLMRYARRNVRRFDEGPPEGGVTPTPVPPSPAPPAPAAAAEPETPTFSQGERVRYTSDKGLVFEGTVRNQYQANKRVIVHMDTVISPSGKTAPLSNVEHNLPPEAFERLPEPAPPAPTAQAEHVATPAATRPYQVGDRISFRVDGIGTIARIRMEPGRPTWYDVDSDNGLRINGIQEGEIHEVLPSVKPPEPVERPARGPAPTTPGPGPAVRPRAGGARGPGTPGESALGGVSPEDVPGPGAPGTPAADAEDGGAAGPPDDQLVNGPGDELPGGVGDSPARNTAAERRGRAGSEPRARATQGGGKPGHDFVISDPAALLPGGAKTRYAKNVQAIRLVKELEAAERHATPEEQAILAQYTGWGAIPQVFDTKYERSYNAGGEWAKEYAELKELLTPEEWARANASTPNAHYTSGEVISAIYDGLARLGFTGGRVLEPSMGTGNFYGAMPNPLRTSSKLTGIELDSLTGRIARQLYQSAMVHIKGFQDVPLSDNFFDLAVSNVPFGNYKVHDPKYNRLNFSIHNYFFAKALDKVRPGGIVAFITSPFTLDSLDPTAREYLASKAELLGAIRLPQQTFAALAGTDTTTDILFLQKRGPGVQPRETWSASEDLPDSEIHINEYFVRHPEMMLGTMEMAGTMYRAGPSQALVAPEGQDLPEALGRAMQRLPEAVMTPREAAPRAASPQRTAEAFEAGESSLREHAYLVKESQIYQRKGTEFVPVEGVGATQAARITGMAAIRDAFRQALAVQYREASDAEVEAALADLNRVYDTFTAKHGPISKPGNPNIAAFADDPDLQLVLALEQWDPETQTASKAPQFHQRTVRRPVAPSHVDEPTEALKLTLGQKGAIDWDYMTQVTGQDAASLQQALGGVIYQNPNGGGWETADEYLSGNVKSKLLEARAAAEQAPEFQANVEALEQVQPADVPIDRVPMRLGASWVPTTTYQRFLAQLLDIPAAGLKVLYNEPQATWHLAADRYDRRAVANQSTWGSNQYEGLELAEAQMNFKQLKVTTWDSAKQAEVVDQKKTIEVRQKMKAMDKAFGEWLLLEPDVAQDLEQRYNDQFNNLVEKRNDGAHLTFPGLSPLYTLRPYQADAVWRSIQDRSALFAHTVGAGKTLTMTATAMEMRRLGLANKPMFLVPNQLINQWPTEILRFYPGAKVLAATKKDLEKSRRQRFFGRIASGDWDAVVMPYSSFKFIPVSDDWFNGLLEEQIALITQYLNQYRADQGKDSPTVKQLAKQKLNLEAKLRKARKAEKQEQLLTWEEMGIDALFIDEFHNFKNLHFATKMDNMTGLGGRGSDQSFDVYTKIRYIQHMNQGGNVFAATGTPISNSISEVYTLLRYLQPDLLKDLGIEHFDGWAATFATPVTRMEVSPTGKGFQARTSFSQFRNMPEMLTMLKQRLDIRTASQIHLPKPTLAGGKAQEVVVQPSPQLLAFIDTLVQRSKNLKRLGDDNMLKITSEGRKAALDIRLMLPGVPEPVDTKPKAAVRNIMRIWKEYADTRGAQLVFLDLGVPRGKKGKVAAPSDIPDPPEEMAEEADAIEGETAEETTMRESVYHDIKAKLIAAGMPAEQIAFIHDAKSDAQRVALFQKVRQGAIRVLIGNTAKMGEGVNVQTRLIAEHEIDPPWRPSDLEQRVGRMLRPDNIYYDLKIPVQHYRYIMERSFDAYMWQTLERKQRAFGALLEGTSQSRTTEDLGDVVLRNYAEALAASTGNPLVFEKFNLEMQIEELDAVRSGALREQSQMRRELAGNPAKQREYEGAIANRLAMIHRFETAEQEQSFSVTIGGKVYTDPEAAGKVLLSLAKEAQRKAFQNDTAIDEIFGTYLGAKLGVHNNPRMRVYNEQKEGYEWLPAPPSLTLDLGGFWPETIEITAEKPDPAQTVARLKTPFRRLPQAIAASQEELARLQKEAQDLEAAIAKPLPHTEELDRMRARLDEILRTTDLETAITADDDAAVGSEGETPED